MAKKQVQLTDKEIARKELQKKLQEFSDKNKYEYMSEFAKAWNAKNKEKILESVKLGNHILFKFSKDTLTVVSDYLKLG